MNEQTGERYRFGQRPTAIATQSMMTLLTFCFSSFCNCTLTCLSNPHRNLEYPERRLSLYRGLHRHFNRTVFEANTFTGQRTVRVLVPLPAGKISRRTLLPSAL